MLDLPTTMPTTTTTPVAVVATSPCSASSDLAARWPHLTPGERRRRAWMQEKAVARLYGEHRPDRQFCEVLCILLRRWPSSVGGDCRFILRLREMWHREDERCREYIAARQRRTA
ncbi:MAG: hypothetical protein ABSG53_17050 [Thermoguttaceae bacterium]|jgi:hypothetical protein